MARNKVIINGETYIDLTSDSVTADRLYVGYTAHGANGEAIVGTLKTVPLDTYIYDLNYGYVDNGTWKYENPTKTYIDMYEVLSGHTYLLLLGGSVGSRFRCMFTTIDVSRSSSNVTGKMIINKNNPSQYNSISYTAPSDGYILIAKDNVGKSGLHSYVFDAGEGLP